jgi:hypothetical protein
MEREDPTIDIPLEQIVTIITLNTASLPFFKDNRKYDIGSLLSTWLLTDGAPTSESRDSP